MLLLPLIKEQRGILKSLIAEVHVTLGLVLSSYSHLAGLRPGSKVCAENMMDWPYLSLGYQEQDEFCPIKVNLDWPSCALTVNYGHVTCHVTKNLKERI